MHKISKAATDGLAANRETLARPAVSSICMAVRETSQAMQAASGVDCHLVDAGLMPKLIRGQFPWG